MPSVRAVLHGCCAGILLVAAACADSTSTAMQPAPGGPQSPSSVRMVCHADVAKGTVACAEPGAADGVRADRILGQGTGVKLTSSNIAVVADTFAFDMTVTNQLAYPIGTTDGVNPDPNGIRVFFVDGIHTTGGTGAVTVANADGVGTFTATGQAYFAYHGVLAPAATTPAHRWKLRFDPGVATFAFDLYISTPVPPGGGHVWMTVSQPRTNLLVADSVVVRVRVDSASASVLSVKASAADRSVTLTPVSPGVLGGTLQLAGVPAGALQLRVHAVTVHADSGDVFVPFTKDSPPVLVVSAPRQNYVAVPDLRIDVDCIDDNPGGCTSLTATALRYTDIGRPVLRELASGTGGIHADVSLDGIGVGMFNLELQAVDSRGQRRYEVFPVYYVVLTPERVVVDSAGNGAMDVDSTRLLFSDTLGYRVWMRDRGTGVRTLLAAGLPRAYGWLHPQGAIFTSPSYPSHLYDWRSGTLVDLGQANSASSLVAKGTWAIWNVGTTLKRRDLITGTNVTVSTISLNYGNDVAANGDVVFTDNSFDVYRYRSGVVTRVTNDPDALYRNASPVTDGTNVLYVKTVTGAQKGRVTLWDGTTETVLGDTTVVPRYAANGGWVAYQKLDGIGNPQIRTRAPDGTDRLVTTSPSFSSTLIALGPDGTVVYSSNGGGYVIRAPYTGTPTRYGGGTAVFRGTELLVFVGNTVVRTSY